LDNSEKKLIPFFTYDAVYDDAYDGDVDDVVAV